MNGYNLTILEISERCMLQAGQQRLTPREVLLHSDYEEVNVSHAQGMALVLSIEARSAGGLYRPRIIKAYFMTDEEGIIMNVTKCCVSINDRNEDNKIQFYERLQSIVGKYLSNELTNLMEDSKR